MYPSEDEVLRIYEQAHRDHPKSNMLAAQQVRRALIDRGLDALLTDATNPGRVAIIKRIGWMLGGVGSYIVHGDAVLVLTDLAADAIAMATVLRDSAIYMNSHWDELSGHPMIKKTNRSKLIRDIAFLSGQLEEFQTDLKRGGGILVDTANLRDMNRAGQNFLFILLGVEPIHAMLAWVNTSILAIHDRIVVDQVAQKMADIPKDKMS